MLRQVVVRDGGEHSEEYKPEGLPEDSRTSSMYVTINIFYALLTAWFCNQSYLYQYLKAAWISGAYN